MKDLGKLTDEAVVKLVCAQDQELYAELVRRYQKKLQRYVGYITGNPAKTADIVQEAFIKAYVNLRGFDTQKRFSSWLYRIAHNEAINAVKKHRREISIEDNLWLGDVLKSESDLEISLTKKEVAREVNGGLKRLPLGYRLPLTLYFLEERSYEEISEIMRLPVGTVGTRIRRGKKRLKKFLETRTRNGNKD